MVFGAKASPAVGVEAKVGSRPALQLELSCTIAVALKAPQPLLTINYRISHHCIPACDAYQKQNQFGMVNMDGW